MTSCTSENARATSFAFVARTSTMRLPYVLLLRTIASVVSMLSTSFCAVPAFRRVDPAMNSGPTTTSMAMSASRPAAESGLHATETDRAERRRASRMARDHVGRPAGRADPDDHVVGRQAERVEVADGGCFVVLRRPRRRWSRRTSPPAITPTTWLGSVPKVGGHSLASRTPSRPGVPAPT